MQQFRGYSRLDRQWDFFNDGECFPNVATSLIKHVDPRAKRQMEAPQRGPFTPSDVISQQCAEFLLPRQVDSVLVHEVQSYSTHLSFALDPDLDIVRLWTFMFQLQLTRAICIRCGHHNILSGTAQIQEVDQPHEIVSIHLSFERIHFCHEQTLHHPIRRSTFKLIVPSAPMVGRLMHKCPIPVCWVLDKFFAHHSWAHSDDIACSFLFAMVEPAILLTELCDISKHVYFCLALLHLARTDFHLPQSPLHTKKCLADVLYRDIVVTSHNDLHQVQVARHL